MTGWMVLDGLLSLLLVAAIVFVLVAAGGGSGTKTVLPAVRALRPIDERIDGRGQSRRRTRHGARPIARNPAGPPDMGQDGPGFRQTDPLL
jgi:hypothetical protein